MEKKKCFRHYVNLGFFLDKPLSRDELVKRIVLAFPESQKMQIAFDPKNDAIEYK